MSEETKVPLGATWFKVSYWGVKIEPVTVFKNTSASIWTAHGRQKMHGVYERYFPTWEEAHAALLQRVTGSLKYARDSVAAKEREYATVSEMTKP